MIYTCRRKNFTGYFCAMKNWRILLVVLLFITSCANDKRENPQDRARPEVIDKLTSEVKRYPDSAGLRMRLINSMDSLNMYKQAIDQTDSLIKRDSLNNGLWYTKAQLQEDNKDTAAAIRSYTRAINIYPSSQAQLSLANLYAEARNPKALSICQNVYKLRMGRETDAGCDFISGIYYARTGKSDEALQFFDKAINDNYTLAEAYMEKGFIYFERKDYQQALKIFETVVTINNTYADAYYWRAKCEEALGNKAKAVLDYKRSLGLDKKLKEAAEAVKRLE